MLKVVYVLQEHNRVENDGKKRTFYERKKGNFVKIMFVCLLSLDLFLFASVWGIENKLVCINVRK